MGLLSNWIKNNVSIFHKVFAIPTSTSENGVYFVKATSFTGLYIVSTKSTTKQVIKIFNSEDWYTRTIVDEKLAEKQTAIDNLQDDTTLKFQQKQTQIDQLSNELALSTSDLIYQDAVDTINDTTGGKTSLTSEYPTPAEGWAALVRDLGFIYAWNGVSWANTGMKVFPEDVAIKSDIIAPILSSANDLSTLELIILVHGNNAEYGLGVRNLADGYIYTCNGFGWKKTGLKDFPADVVSKELLRQKTQIQGTTFNFIDNPFWKFIPSELTQNAKTDYSIIEAGDNTYFNYKGKCLKLSSVLSETRDWRITASSAQALIGQKIKVLTELFVVNLNLGCVISTLNGGDIIGSYALKNGYNVYEFEFTHTGESVIELFIPMNIVLNAGVEVYIGRTYIGLDGNGSIIGDNLNDYVKNKTLLGRLETANNPFGATHGIATNTSPALVAGTLSSIQYRAETSGIAKFGVGIIDQRSIAVIRKTFEVDVLSGMNDLDVREMAIDVNIGELLFVYFGENANPMFGIGMSESDVTIKYNVTDPALPIYPIGSTYGGYIDLAWTISEINSLFYAPNYQLKRLESTVESFNNQVTRYISTADLLTDISTEQKYKIRISNGAINLIPQQFSNAVVIGNSISRYAASAPIWWGGGMAAHQQSEDFVHILEAGLRVKNGLATVTPIPNFRYEFDLGATDLTTLDSYLTSDTDLIVFQLGENINAAVSDDTIKSTFKDLVKHCASQSPNAEIIITGVFWIGERIDACLQSVAIDLGLTFVKKSQLDIPENKSFIGDVVIGLDGLEHFVNDNGVAAHPNSLGHKRIANLILNSIGYNEVI